MYIHFNTIEKKREVVIKIKKEVCIKSIDSAVVKMHDHTI